MGSEAICRHQIITSANEVFSGVGLSRTPCLGGSLQMVLHLTVDL